MGILRSIAAEYAWDGWLIPLIEIVQVDRDRLAKLAGQHAGGTNESLFKALGLGAK